MLAGASTPRFAPCPICVTLVSDEESSLERPAEARGWSDPSTATCVRGGCQRFRWFGSTCPVPAFLSLFNSPSPPSGSHPGLRREARLQPMEENKRKEHSFWVVGEHAGAGVSVVRMRQRSACRRQPKKLESRESAGGGAGREAARHSLQTPSLCAVTAAGSPCREQAGWGHGKPFTEKEPEKNRCPRLAVAITMSAWHTSRKMFKML